MRGRTARERAEAFLEVSGLFRLGDLPTERPHPRTRRLAEWSRRDLPRALAVLRSIDLDALDVLEQEMEAIEALASAIGDTVRRGHRIFLCGCGATGRLALSLELLWRRARPGNDQVQAFMAGGDVALVHALEGFEDHPDLGARHLEETGFRDGDLLVACTEGGETPYVIGATRRAAALSRNAPFFLHCNDEAALSRHVARFRDVRDDPDIRRICLNVGPMALSGSTRMQASTVLQAAVGAALLADSGSPREQLAGFRYRVGDIDFESLAALVAAEADVYRAGDHVTYRVRDFGITVLTDTTERAPTFSLVPFDQLRETRAAHSLCYVALDEARSAADAWQHLLQRPPRALDWPEVDSRTSVRHLMGFDFSAGAARRRRRQIPHRRHHPFFIGRDGDGLELRLGAVRRRFDLAGLPELHQHLLLKLLLNAHSTLVMGRLGRYHGNVMTWVTPTNGKLVDRAARYVDVLLGDAGEPSPGYEGIVHRLFDAMERAAPGESVVLRTFESLRRRRRTG